MKTANDCGTTIQIKRSCQQQTNRVNYEREQKDFYRNSIFIPYLDNLISELESMLNKPICSLVPNVLPSLNTKEPGFINKTISNRYTHTHITMKNYKILIALRSSIVEMLLGPVRGATINPSQINANSIHSSYHWDETFIKICEKWPAFYNVRGLYECPYVIIYTQRLIFTLWSDYWWFSKKKSQKNIISTSSR